MKIVEKTIVSNSILFSEEDVKLIKSITAEVYSDIDVRYAIMISDRNLGRSLVLMSRISRSALYNEALTVEDIDSITLLTDIICSFEMKNPNDERIPQLNELFAQLTEAKTAMYKEM